MHKVTSINTHSSINCGGKLLDLSSPKIMGIVNLTPDSFYDGGRNTTMHNVLKTVQKHISEGADILDFGAYSSRPGATDISVLEEERRLIPVLKEVKTQFPDAILSVDTFRASIAEKAIHTGAHIINDISGGSLDGNMFKTVTELSVPYIMMHMQGTPQTMKTLTNYSDGLLNHVKHYFSEKLYALRQMGVKDIILDPGFGFAKTTTQNFELLKCLNELITLFEAPFLVGVSRKSMIYKTLNTSAEKSLNGTTCLNTVALLNGAKILRVHDVKQAVEVRSLVGALEN